MRSENYRNNRLSPIIMQTNLIIKSSVKQASSHVSSSGFEDDEKLPVPVCVDMRTRNDRDRVRQYRSRYKQWRLKGLRGTRQKMTKEKQFKLAARARATFVRRAGEHVDVSRMRNSDRKRYSRLLGLARPPRLPVVAPVARPIKSNSSPQSNSQILLSAVAKHRRTGVLPHLPVADILSLSHPLVSAAQKQALVRAMLMRSNSDLLHPGPGTNEERRAAADKRHNECPMAQPHVLSNGTMSMHCEGVRKFIDDKKTKGKKTPLAVCKLCGAYLTAPFYGEPREFTIWGCHPLPGMFVSLKSMDKHFADIQPVNMLLHDTRKGAQIAAQYVEQALADEQSEEDEKKEDAILLARLMEPKSPSISSAPGQCAAAVCNKTFAQVVAGMQGTSLSYPAPPSAPPAAAPLQPPPFAATPPPAVVIVPQAVKPAAVPSAVCIQIPNHYPSVERRCASNPMQFLLAAIVTCALWSFSLARTYLPIGLTKLSELYRYVVDVYYTEDHESFNDVNFDSNDIVKEQDVDTLTGGPLRDKQKAALFRLAFGVEIEPKLVTGVQMTMKNKGDRRLPSARSTEQLKSDHDVMEYTYDEYGSWQRLFRSVALISIGILFMYVNTQQVMLKLASVLYDYMNAHMGSVFDTQMRSFLWFVAQFKSDMSGTGAWSLWQLSQTLGYWSFGITDYIFVVLSPVSMLVSFVYYHEYNIWVTLWVLQVMAPLFEKSERKWVKGAYELLTMMPLRTWYVFIVFKALPFYERQVSDTDYTRMFSAILGIWSDPSLPVNLGMLKLRDEYTYTVTPFFRDIVTKKFLPNNSGELAALIEHAFVTVNVVIVYSIVYLFFNRMYQLHWRSRFLHIAFQPALVDDAARVADTSAPELRLQVIQQHRLHNPSFPHDASYQYQLELANVLTAYVKSDKQYQDFSEVPALAPASRYRTTGQRSARSLLWVQGSLKRL